jgi:hypothetical protein
VTPSTAGTSPYALRRSVTKVTGGVPSKSGRLADDHPNDDDYRRANDREQHER